jgi:hypothetical protein
MRFNSLRMNELKSIFRSDLSVSFTREILFRRFQSHFFVTDLTEHRKIFSMHVWKYRFGITLPLLVLIVDVLLGCLD